MTTTEFQRAFFESLPVTFTGEALFDCLPDVVFFVKDRQARYVVVNQTLVERCRVPDKQSLIGRTTSEIFPAPLGGHYQTQDEQVIASRTPIHDRLELHLRAGGVRGWCLTEKIPLLGRRGEALGLVGVSRDLIGPNAQSPDYALMARVVEYVQSHLSDELNVGELAARERLSIYRLDQRMRAVFQLTTAQFIQKCRLDEASRRLLTTDEPIAQIAFDCGYADHSAFTRNFKRTVGVSPNAFRQTRQLTG
ncbi:MAG: AraC family transcriptional regulator [Planctomycetes bacterium]|nr:AraC family transcriptional regulator [Planctomycetota bacterium]